MTNYGQDLNYPILNQLYNFLSYGNWPCFHYFYYPTQIGHSFFPQQSRVDESQNDCIQIKKEQNNQYFQIITQAREIGHKTKDYKQKEQTNKINDTNYINKCQKSDRNLNSIVIRNFVNFINGHPRLLKIVDTIIQKRNLNISAQEFKKQFKEKFPLRQPYVGVGKLRKFIENGKQHHDLRKIYQHRFLCSDVKFSKIISNCKRKGIKAWEKVLERIFASILMKIIEESI